MKHQVLLFPADVRAHYQERQEEEEWKTRIHLESSSSSLSVAKNIWAAGLEMYLEMRKRVSLFCQIRMITG